MNLRFLGSGGAFTLENFHSNLILTADNGMKLLIDCGTDIRFSLKEAGLSYSDIHSIYISHLHGDHAGGLEYMGFVSYFTPSFDRPELILSKVLVNPLWNALGPSMGSVQGRIADLNDYFNVRPVGAKSQFVWNGINFQMVQTLHVNNGYAFEPSFGLMFEMNGKKVLFTGDTSYYPDQLSDLYSMSDVIFHDCENGPYKSGVHAHFEELATLPPEIRMKMWLYHTNDNTEFDANVAGFKGYVKKGDVFE